MKVRLQGSEELGSTIRNIRNELGKTLSEVAESTGISKSYLSQIESGKVANPTVELLGRVVKALGVDLIIQGSPAEVSDSLAYQSGFTLEGANEEGTKKSAVELVVSTLRDPEIPDQYKRLLERQITALIYTLKEELQHRGLGNAGKASQN